MHSKRNTISTIITFTWVGFSVTSAGRVLIKIKPSPLASGLICSHEPMCPRSRKLPSHTGVPGNVSQKCSPRALLWRLGMHRCTVLFPHLGRVESAGPLSLPFGLLRLFTDFFPLIWKPDTLLPGCLPGLQPGPAWVSVPTGNEM